MSKEITIKEKKIHIQYLDAKTKSTSTFDLLNYVREKNKKTKIYFLMGADNLLKFHKWNKWKLIPKLAKMIVFQRRAKKINHPT